MSLPSFADPAQVRRISAQPGKEVNTNTQLRFLGALAEDGLHARAVQEK
jgi:hypothetical protein